MRHSRCEIRDVQRGGSYHGSWNSANAQCLLAGTDVEEAKRVARRIEADVVWINQIHVMSPQVAMGGIKQSGFGVENGRAGLAHYCNLQVVLNKE